MAESSPKERAFPTVPEVEAAYAEAAGLGFLVERWIRIGGHTIQLRFATPGLVPCIMPAFGHLAIDPGQAPELVVEVWDSRSTGAKPAPTPEVDPDAPTAAFYFFQDPPVRAGFHPRMGALSVLDHGTDHAWYFVDDPEALPYWERAAPIRQILHWWMATRGHQQVHSGAVGLPDGGVLLVGKGGSGKSTSSLISLTSDLRYAGDDYAMVSLEPYPRVHSLYSSGKVHQNNLARLPHMVAALSNADKLATEKGVAFVDQHFPDRMIGGFPLRAIVLPTITGRPDTRTVPTSSAAALAALAPSSVLQLPTERAEALRYLARLVRLVPAYTLELGSDVRDVSPVLLRLLEDLSRAGYGQSAR